MEMNIVMKQTRQYSAPVLNSEQVLWSEGGGWGWETGKKRKELAPSLPPAPERLRPSPPPLLSPSESLLAGYSRPYFASYLDVRQCA